MIFIIGSILHPGCGLRG